MKRFRMVAGPNGSGKSTLMHRLSNDYAVNFYDVLNADDIFAEVQRTGAYQPCFGVEASALSAYASSSSYDDRTKSFFANGTIILEDDCVRFRAPEAVSSYTIALLTNFLQSESIRQGRSFSQETVFSHDSKIEALKQAAEAGYRTYLYFVATDSCRINLGRVANRVRQGGHSVPADKIESRYDRSLANLPKALPYVSRLFLFDNSGESMRYLAQWNHEAGFVGAVPKEGLPSWIVTALEGVCI